MQTSAHLEEQLDLVFQALSNRTRRSLLDTLRSGPARVGELARPHGISVNAVSKHLFVLERAGLIKRSTEGHVQSCVLDAGPLSTAEEWLEAYRKFWDGKLDSFVNYVESQPRRRTP